MRGGLEPSLGYLAGGEPPSLIAAKGKSERGRKSAKVEVAPAAVTGALGPPPLPKFSPFFNLSPPPKFLSIAL